jgi:hypothetical protein
MAAAAVAALLLAMLAVAAPTTLGQEAAQQATAAAGQRAPRGPRIAFELPPATDCSLADLPQLVHRGEWRSKLDRTLSANVTMVTQLTVSR